MPSSSQTGTPRHFQVSTMFGSASLINPRSLPSIAPRQPPSSLIFASISCDGVLLVAAGFFAAAFFGAVFFGAVFFGAVFFVTFLDFGAVFFMSVRVYYTSGTERDVCSGRMSCPDPT